MGADLMGQSHGDFESFLRDWSADRIWRIDDVLEPHDQQYMVVLRAAELTRIAAEKGFSDDLQKITERFGSVLQYVKHLFWDAELGAPPGSGTRFAASPAPASSV
jgi:hypothetical protein